MAGPSMELGKIMNRSDLSLNSFGSRIQAAGESAPGPQNSDAEQQIGRATTTRLVPTVVSWLVVEPE